MREVLEGLEDLSCYDEFWLNKDMENMGYFVTNTVKKFWLIILLF